MVDKSMVTVLFEIVQKESYPKCPHSVFVISIFALCLYAVTFSSTDVNDLERKLFLQ